MSKYIVKMTMKNKKYQHLFEDREFDYNPHRWVENIATSGITGSKDNIDYYFPSSEIEVIKIIEA